MSNRQSIVARLLESVCSRVCIFEGLYDAKRLTGLVPAEILIFALLILCCSIRADSEARQTTNEVCKTQDETLIINSKPFLTPQAFGNKPCCIVAAHVLPGF